MLQLGEGSYLTAVIGALLTVSLAPKRSRHIPASVRRRVIDRDLKGELFDPEKHHIDHIWPWSRGGGHDPRNLRVVSKRANLKKGKKAPKLQDWL